MRCYIEPAKDATFSITSISTLALWRAGSLGVVGITTVKRSGLTFAQGLTVALCYCANMSLRRVAAYDEIIWLIVLFVDPISWFFAAWKGSVVAKPESIHQTRNGRPYVSAILQPAKKFGKSFVLLASNRTRIAWREIRQFLGKPCSQVLYWKFLEFKIVNSLSCHCDRMRKDVTGPFAVAAARFCSFIMNVVGIWSLQIRQPLAASRKSRSCCGLLGSSTSVEALNKGCWEIYSKPKERLKIIPRPALRTASATSS